MREKNSGVGGEEGKGGDKRKGVGRQAKRKMKKRERVRKTGQKWQDRKYFKKKE